MTCNNFFKAPSDALSKQQNKINHEILPTMKCTLIIKEGKDGFLIGQLKELPEVFTQGLTTAEVKENISDVLEMYLEDLKGRTTKSPKSHEVKKTLCNFVFLVVKNNKPRSHRSRTK
jgi:predicted RNase H-like HicB family nuclease